MDETVSQVMRTWDRNGDGRIDYDAWLSSLRGSLNKRRTRMVELVYNALKERCVLLFVMKDRMALRGVKWCDSENQE